jgi:pimeloyl-ACP methyl ester carboxylesterase
VDLEPPPLERLDEVGQPVLVLSGGLDIDAILAAADRLEAGLPNVRAVRWPDAAHVPSMEHPDRFARLTLDWLAEVEGG